MCLLVFCASGGTEVDEMSDQAKSDHDIVTRMEALRIIGASTENAIVVHELSLLNYEQEDINENVQNDWI